MPKTYRVALLGFSDFERNTLASYFRLASHRDPSYELVSVGAESDFILADADHAPSVQLVVATERLGETVFIGSQAPGDAVAWMMRPIDPLHVMRELDALLALAASGGPGSAGPPGARSTTAIRVPRRPRVAGGAESAVAGNEGVGPASAPVPSSPPPPSALLVDDSPIALRFLESRLQPWGLTVECVGSSGRAIERLAQRNYDFVFLDVELGSDSELDGLALCQHIKRHHPLSGSVLVMVSAHNSELDRVRGTLAGCDAYLGKPLRAAELERLLLRQGLKAPPVPTLTPAAQPAAAATGAERG